jgi:hypothetical protein
MFRTRKRRLTLALVAAYVPLAVAYLSFSGQLGAADWRTASREPAGLAPDPATTPEAVVQVYSARAVSWRGWFGVHSWIAVKRANASEFTVHEVMGWRLKRTGNVVVERNRTPDGHWYGNRPELLGDIRGPGVEEIIDRIDAAAKEYPYPNRYHIWPGPNSNTFVAFILRKVPELRVDLPPTAIGKDYLGWRSVHKTPSGTGGQASLFGVVGVAAGLEEGLEVNLLGLNFGVDPKSLSLKLPIVGRIGPRNRPEPKQIPLVAVEVTAQSPPPQPPPQPPPSPAEESPLQPSPSVEPSTLESPNASAH